MASGDTGNENLVSSPEGGESRTVSFTATIGGFKENQLGQVITAAEQRNVTFATDAGILTRDSKTGYQQRTENFVITTPAELGMDGSHTRSEIYQKAGEQGLVLCNDNDGPLLALSEDQTKLPEGKITVASKLIMNRASGIDRPPQMNLCLLTKDKDGNLVVSPVEVSKLNTYPEESKFMFRTLEPQKPRGLGRFFRR